MLFNSLEFALFLPIVFALYWLIPKKKVRFQNFLLLVASYVFYGWWDWRFLFLIAFSSGVDFIVGLSLNKIEDKGKRKFLLLTSVFVNLGLLGFFKYYNFFMDSFVDAFSLMGQSLTVDRLNIVLPVGISFYTLQTLSYTIDVYDRKIKGTNDFISFFAYVSFFPQLVAGPIERATNLLPQFQKERSFDYNEAADGMRQILWGLFKKMVIADNISRYTGDVFTNYGDYGGSTLFLAALLFVFLVYCDFSGYSDIAIGTARLFGFDLMKNFNFPFFSRDMAELWNRWHISLISWYKDYIVNRFRGFRRWQVVRNVFVIFIITGIWHGASWTYVLWGILQAVLFLPIIFSKGRLKYKVGVAHNTLLPSLKEMILMVKTYLLFAISSVFFAIQSIKDGVFYMMGMFDFSFFSKPAFPPKMAVIAMLIMLVIEWFQREKEHGLDLRGFKVPTLARWGIYYAVASSIILYGGESKAFEYFQF